MECAPQDEQLVTGRAVNFKLFYKQKQKQDTIYVSHQGLGVFHVIISVATVLSASAAAVVVRNACIHQDDDDLEKEEAVFSWSGD
mgnify:CR=1 FL=1